MDNQVLLTQFEEIEGKIERLIGACRTLESENVELKNKIERLEGELQGKAAQEAQFSQERDQIRDRIGNLLDRLAETDGE
ncbi:MAG: cell division protein ZapB [Desulfobacterales bacterium]|nr:cell division protein ZapB [Desulfobacterales bacterium]